MRNQKPCGQLIVLMGLAAGLEFLMAVSVRGILGVSFLGDWGHTPKTTPTYVDA
jgi:hypothetical protein